MKNELPNVFSDADELFVLAAKSVAALVIVVVGVLAALAWLVHWALKEYPA